jgi:hypothetical protein
MYILILKYGYLFGIIFFFFLSPIITFKIDQKIFKNKNLYRVFFINLLIFSIAVVILLYIKSLHIHMFEDTCFEYPIMVYKDSLIPKECYSFNIMKYQGIGWTIKSIFWIVLEFFYLLFIYTIIKYKR